MKYLAIIGLLLVTACTSIPVEQVDHRLQAWKATEINQLIKYWGVPTKQQQINGKNYAEWLNKESTPGNTAVSIGSGGRSRNNFIGFGITLFDLGGSDDICSRIVTYDENGMVTEISWKGTRDFCFKITPDRGQMQKNKAQMDSH